MFTTGLGAGKLLVFAIAGILMAACGGSTIAAESGSTANLPRKMWRSSTTQRTPNATVPTVRISGVALDTTGKAVQDAWVAAFSLEESVFEALPSDRVRTNDHGGFVLVVPDGQGYAITATAVTADLSPAYVLSTELQGDRPLDHV